MKNQKKVIVCLLTVLFTLMFICPAGYADYCASPGTLPSYDDALFPENDYYLLYDDGYDDRTVRRTSTDNYTMPPSWVQPELLQYRIGNWAPTDPSTDLYSGSWTYDQDKYFRVDLLVRGLVGPIGSTEPGANWAPFQYACMPLNGVVEFDVDHYATGGETARPEDYFLGNVARFGARVYAVSGYSLRTAKRWYDLHTGFSVSPQTKWTGADFKWRFGGQYMTSIASKQGGDTDEFFESGETWVVTGRFFCRSGGYEDAQFWGGLDGSPQYCPVVQNRYSHDSTTGTTVISLVFPVVNPSEAIDYNSENEVSIEEALDNLTHAAYYNYYPVYPPYALLSDWQDQYPTDYLDGYFYSMKLLIGTAFAESPTDSQPFLWTDYSPNQVSKDYNGDGVVNSSDRNLFDSYVSTYDGNADYDSDGNSTNGSLTIPSFPRNFSIYDANYDGVVNSNDRP